MSVFHNENQIIGHQTQINQIICHKPPTEPKPLKDYWEKALDRFCDVHPEMTVNDLCDFFAKSNDINHQQIVQYLNKASRDIRTVLKELLSKGFVEWKEMKKSIIPKLKIHLKTKGGHHHQQKDKCHDMANQQRYKGGPTHRKNNDIDCGMYESNDGAKYKRDKRSTNVKRRRHHGYGDKYGYKSYNKARKSCRHHRYKAYNDDKSHHRHRPRQLVMSSRTSPARSPSPYLEKKKVNKQRNRRFARGNYHMLHL